MCERGLPGAASVQAECGDGSDQALPARRKVILNGHCPLSSKTAIPSFWPSLVARPRCCRWRSRLGPLLEAWDKMASSVTNSSAAAAAAGRGGGNSTGRRGSRRLSGGSGGGSEGRQVPPVDAFVAMENESAVGLCEIVSASLGSVKKVRG